MGIPVLIYGKSGSGKSRSIKNFGEEEIILINVDGKELPFRKTFKHSYCVEEPSVIIKYLNRAYEVGIRTAVIDDCGLSQQHHFYKNHRNKTGNSQFEMYDEIADRLYFIVDWAKTELPKDMVIYIILHETVDDCGNAKILYIGKQLERKAPLETRCTVVLRCMSENGRHYFCTTTDGRDITKTPEGMFEDAEIDNDLKAVDTAIRDYWNI